MTVFSPEVEASLQEDRLMKVNAIRVLRTATREYIAALIEDKKTATFSISSTNTPEEIQNLANSIKTWYENGSLAAWNAAEFIDWCNRAEDHVKLPGFASVLIDDFTGGDTGDYYVQSEYSFKRYRTLELLNNYRKVQGEHAK